MTDGLVEYLVVTFPVGKASDNIAASHFLAQASTAAERLGRRAAELVKRTASRSTLSRRGSDPDGH